MAKWVVSYTSYEKTDIELSFLITLEKVQVTDAWVGPLPMIQTTSNHQNNSKPISITPTISFTITASNQYITSREIPCQR